MFGAVEQAIDEAVQSVWVTIAFISSEFRFPRSGRSFFELLSAASARGVDVRVLFWRHDERTAVFEPDIFAGTPDQFSWLEATRCELSARWDRPNLGRCHHQKAWTIDAGTPGGVAFVGGMNLNPRNLHHDHRDIAGFHDIGVEVRGPAVSDVANNFVQRWNGASERRARDGRWGGLGNADLGAVALVDPIGSTPVRIVRTVDHGLYGRESSAAGGSDAVGERSILALYQEAFAGACEAIYIENQSILSTDLLPLLGEALARGVEVLAVVPFAGEAPARNARHRGECVDLFTEIERLATRPNFTLVGPRTDQKGELVDIHVHSKAVMVDDDFVMIGSANLRDNSLNHNTELNAAFWCQATARQLRAEISEHFGVHATPLQRPQRWIAGIRDRLDADDAGLLHTIDARSYGAAR